MTATHKFATATATTKRPPAISGGKRGAPVAHLSGVRCDPPLPVDGEVSQRAGLQSPVNVFETFVYSNVDILKGDKMTVSSTEYDVRAVEAWPATGPMGAYKHIVMELVID